MKQCRICNSYALNIALESELYDVCYYKNHLMNLLAIVHRDGGQYVGEHGLDKAVEDAKQIVANTIVR